jgi:rhodanese-related sulfurtransferase/biotin operon repressor
MSSAVAKAALFDGFARIGHALASGRRAEIVDLLANGERSVESLASALGMSMANASQHLQILRRAGLIVGRRQGNQIYYTLAGDDVFTLWSTLRSVAAQRVADVERLAAEYLEHRDTLQPVTREELVRRLRERLPPIVLDVRPREEYETAHVPGAVSIPVSELRRRLREVPRERDVVAYCRGPYCVFAHEAVQILRSAGYDARRLEDGLPEWQHAGLAVAIGPTDADESAPARQHRGGRR